MQVFDTIANMEFKRTLTMDLDPARTVAASDHHFGSSSLLSVFKVLSKPEEKKALEIWNSTVASTDTVIYVGDFCDSSILEASQILKSLSGKKKILVLGNHDTFPVEVYFELFDNVCSELLDKRTGIAFRHCPKLDDFKDKQVYGHFHRKHSGWPAIKNGCCVCASRNSLKPLRFSEFEFFN